MSWFDKIKQLFRFKHPQTVVKESNLDENVIKNPPWWGHYKVEEDQARFFKIGSIVLCLDRYSHEWHITIYRDTRTEMDIPHQENDLPSPTIQKTLKELPQNIRPYKTLSAYTSNEIFLNPTLPDRPLLTALAHQYYIPPNQSLLIFIRYPAWIRIKAGKPAIYLDEIPTEVISDSWYGSNTRIGELCYEVKTESSPYIEDLPMDVTHVTSPVRIENRSKETLLIKEVKIPLPYLSIYCDQDNQLWTQEITFSQEGFLFPHTTIGKGAPKMLKSAKLLTSSRLTAKSSFLDLLRGK